MHRNRALTIGIVGTLLFAAAHVYWALGGRIGVPAAAPPIGDRPVFLTYDVVSAVVLVAAAAVAVRLRSPLPPPAVVRLTTIGAVLALLRGGVGLTQDAWSAVVERHAEFGVVFDLWFALTGALFLVLALRIAQATGTTSSTSTASPLAPARTPRRPRIMT